MEIPKGSPTVTVGVPVLNGERYLERALAGLSDQTLADIEIIVSDNASVDSSRAIAESFAARDPRFVVLPPTARLGLPDNFNRTLAAARGEFFMWNSSDDVALPDHLAACVAALRDHPEAITAFSQVERIDSDDRTIGVRDDADLDFSVAGPNRVALFFRRQVFQVIGYGGVHRTATLREAGGLPRRWGSDLILGVKLAVQGTWVEVPHRLYRERVHAEQSTNMQGGDPVQQVRMFEPERHPRVAFPMWALTRDINREILRSDLPARERARTLAMVARRWSIPEWRLFAWDIKRNAVRTARGTYGHDHWSDAAHEARGDQAS